MTVDIVNIHDVYGHDSLRGCLKPGPARPAAEYVGVYYDTIGEFNVDWKLSIQLYLAHVARKRN